MATSSKRKEQETAKDPAPKRKPFSLKLRAPSTSIAAMQSSAVADSPVTSFVDFPSRNVGGNDNIANCNSKTVQQKCKPTKEARLTLLEFEEKEHCIRLDTLQMENKTASRLQEKADFEFDAIKKEHALRMELMKAQLQGLQSQPSTWSSGEQSSYPSSNYFQANYHSL